MNRVLIIEDETVTAEAVKEALALDDISADIASDGESGLQKFVANNYDLILLDLKMPGLSGDEVLSEIRKRDPFVDVIIYTNYTDFADIKKADGHHKTCCFASATFLYEFIREML